jgi:hypothetical protein
LNLKNNFKLKIGGKSVVSVGMKLFDENGSEAIVYYVSGDIFGATITKKITVTYNNGKDHYTQEKKKDAAFSISDLGKTLFLITRTLLLHVTKKRNELKLHIFRKRNKLNLHVLKKRDKLN